MNDRDFNLAATMAGFDMKRAKHNLERDIAQAEVVRLERKKKITNLLLTIAFGFIILHVICIVFTFFVSRQS